MTDRKSYLGARANPNNAQDRVRRENVAREERLDREQRDRSMREENEERWALERAQRETGAPR